jgi:hypothetical protein
MPPIPIYLKTEANGSRPADAEFYWMTRNGLFLCRNHPFFASDVPARRSPRALAEHQPACVLSYPRLSRPALEYIVGFFDRVFQLHRSEAIVLLLWNYQKRHYKLWVPPQEATVWESYSGRSPMDVRYKVPAPLPAGHLLVGDIHCHGNIAAYSSLTDQTDEVYRDGVHAIVGHIEREPPDFHLEMSIDGHRFDLEFDQLFQGYQRRRSYVHPNWLAQVSVKVERPWSYRNAITSGDWFRSGSKRKRWE